MEIPVLTHVLTQKGARFVKPRVQMAVSVPLVKQFTSSNGSQISRAKGVPFQLEEFFFL